MAGIASNRTLPAAVGICVGGARQPSELPPLALSAQPAVGAAPLSGRHDTGDPLPDDLRAFVGLISRSHLDTVAHRVRDRVQGLIPFDFNTSSLVVSACTKDGDTGVHKAIKELDIDTVHSVEVLNINCSAHAHIHANKSKGALLIKGRIRSIHKDLCKLDCHVMVPSAALRVQSLILHKWRVIYAEPLFADIMEIHFKAV